MGELNTTVKMELSDELKKTLNEVKTTVEEVNTKNAKNIEEYKNQITTDIKNQAKKIDHIEKVVNKIKHISQPTTDPTTCGYVNKTEFFYDVIKAGMSGNRPDKMSDKLRARWNAVGSDEARVASNPDGGFLVPEAFLPGLMKLDPNALQTDTGAYTKKIPMANQLVKVNARVDKDHSSSVSGGFQLYRRAETDTVTATKTQYEQIQMQANSLMGLSYATDEILTMSPISFAALIQEGFADEKKSKLNYERIWGSGVGEFTGFMNSPALISVAKESGQTADTINGTNILKMRARAYRYGSCVWLANQDTYLQLCGAHKAGTNSDVFLFAPGNGVDVPDTLLGRPVIFDENMATLGDTGDIALVNFNEYLEGSLGGIKFDESIHVRFIYNERAFRFTIYNDGQPWWRTALTPKKSSTTLSPYISLAERA